MFRSIFFCVNFLSQNTDFVNSFIAINCEYMSEQDLLQAEYQSRKRTQGKQLKFLSTKGFIVYSLFSQMQRNRGNAQRTADKWRFQFFSRKNVVVSPSTA